VHKGVSTWKSQFVTPELYAQLRGVMRVPNVNQAEFDAFNRWQATSKSLFPRKRGSRGSVMTVSGDGFAAELQSVAAMVARLNERVFDSRFSDNDGAGDGGSRPQQEGRQAGHN